MFRKAMIVYVGDTLISNDNTAEGTVRKAKKKAEATLIIWLTDEWEISCSTSTEMK